MSTRKNALVSEIAETAVSLTPKHTAVLPRAVMSPRRAAEYLDTTEGTLSQWRHRGEGPPFVRMGRKVVYRVETLDAWLLSLEQRSIGGVR